MKPMLDDLELPLVQEISTFDRRMLAEHRPHGRAGSVFQNLGRRPTRIVLWGVAAEDGSQAFVTSLDEKFKAGAPMPFAADILADTEIENVIIDDLRWQELAGKPDRFAYILTLREHIVPAEPETLAPVDDGLLDEASGLIDDLVAGLDFNLDFINGLAPFLPRLTELSNQLKGAS